MDHDGVVVPLAWLASIGGVIVVAVGTMWYALQRRSDAHVADIKDMHGQAMHKMESTTEVLTDIKSLLAEQNRSLSEANKINGETLVLLKSRIKG